MNRIEPIIDELNETHDQEDQMLMIMEALNNTVTTNSRGGSVLYLCL
jgi:Spy/CpxP family protein refolding chaperone